MEKCIFCDSPLDDSNEHIIPKAINGRLQSKNIICSNCNSKKFGVKIDPVVKEIFKPYLHILGFSNASKLQVEDPEGNKYLLDTKKGVRSVKPKLSIKKKDGKIYMTVTGNEKDTIKLFSKHASKLLHGQKPIQLKAKRIKGDEPPLSVHAPIELSSSLVILFNKIALEYFAHCGLDISLVKELLVQIGKLDTEIDNVTFCNQEGNVRDYDPDEISHLIAIRVDTNTGILYCYIELFNIVCGFIPLAHNYKGRPISFTYRQDALDGKVINPPEEINLDVKALISDKKRLNEKLNFDLLTQAFSDRHRTRTFQRAFDLNMEAIKNELDEKTLSEQEYIDEYVKRSSEIVAYLTVYEFPYILEDQSDEQMHQINYIHSNLFEKDFKEFVRANSHLFGLRFDFEGEGVYSLDSFTNHPVAKYNSETVVHVSCVLKAEDSEIIKYVPYRNIFDSVVMRQSDQNGGS